RASTPRPARRGEPAPRSSTGVCACATPRKRSRSSLFGGTLLGLQAIALGQLRPAGALVIVRQRLVRRLVARVLLDRTGEPAKALYFLAMFEEDDARLTAPVSVLRLLRDFLGQLIEALLGDLDAFKVGLDLPRLLAAAKKLEALEESI